VQHLRHRGVTAVEGRQLRHGKLRSPLHRRCEVIDRQIEACQLLSGLARMAARSPRADALAAAIMGT
jgi:hypothetical protein